MIAFVNLARLKSRGPRAWGMAVAALAFGVGALGYRAEWPTPALVGVGVVVFLGLCADAFLGIVLGKPK